MSRRARARASARPWELQRDAGEADHVEDLLAMVGEDTDQHLRERAWQQREREQQQHRSEA